METLMEDIETIYFKNEVLKSEKFKYNLVYCY